MFCLANYLLVEIEHIDAGGKLFRVGHKTRLVGKTNTVCLLLTNAKGHEYSVLGLLITNLEGIGRSSLYLYRK